MRRREFITFIGGALVGWPLTARAQQGGPVRLIGVLMAQVESNSAAQSWLAAFRDELAKLGWKEGSNLRIELRWSTDNAEALRKLAKELVDLRPDAILGRGTSETIALAGETKTIPIVFAAVSDPIGSGFTASLARPGGNITGFTNVESTLGGKWVELLKEIAPHTVRVSLLFNPKTVAPLQFYLPSIQTAAKSLAVQVSTAPVHAKEEIEGVMAALARDPGGGLIAMPDTFTGANLGLIIALAARYRVPAISYAPLYAESGGLIAYGVNFVGLFRQAAGYIDRILKGAKPADLPVQLPAKLEMVINLKTAKALGLNIQDSFLLRADKVIE
jgi:putative tryptophan/tyrosine transport system substrate-binding protein